MEEGENPSITMAFDDSEVKITFEFDDDFPMDPAKFVNVVARLILSEL